MSISTKNISKGIKVYNSTSPTTSATLQASDSLLELTTEQGSLTVQAEQTLDLKTANNASGASSALNITTGDGSNGTGQINIITSTNPGAGTRGSVNIRGKRINLYTDISESVVVDADVIKSIGANYTDLGTDVHPFRNTRSTSFYVTSIAGVDRLFTGIILQNPASLGGTSDYGIRLLDTVSSNTELALITPDAVDAAKRSPSIFLYTGDSIDVQSGDIVLRTGVPSGAGTKGNIQLDAGEVTLFTDLLPDTTNTKNIGSSSERFASLWSTTTRTNTISTATEADLNINAQAVVTGSGRAVNITSGSAEVDAVATSGSISIGTASNTGVGGSTGNISITTGEATETAGNINIATGQSLNTSLFGNVTISGQTIFLASVTKTTVSGMLQLNPIAVDPSASNAGETYYWNADNTIKYYNGSALQTIIATADGTISDTNVNTSADIGRGKIDRYYERSTLPNASVPPQAPGPVLEEIVFNTTVPASTGTANRTLMINIEPTPNTTTTHQVALNTLENYYISVNGNSYPIVSVAAGTYDLKELLVPILVSVASNAPVSVSVIADFQRVQGCSVTNTNLDITIADL